MLSRGREDIKITVKTIFYTQSQFIIQFELGSDKLKLVESKSGRNYLFKEAEESHPVLINNHKLRKDLLKILVSNNQIRRALSSWRL